MLELLKIYVLVFLIVAAYLVAKQKGFKRDRFIRAEDLYDRSKHRFDGIESIIIDVRTMEEYESGHIDEAINLDYRRSGFQSEILNMDRERTYYIYCRFGNLSNKTVLFMQHHGFDNAYCLKGGFQNWKEQQYPVDTLSKPK